MTAAPIQRAFLGWEQPALPEAARRLMIRYRQDGMLDLGPVIVVVPGQRAGRRLQELLAFLAEDEALQLTPPEVVTEGKLPEMLYKPKLPFANEIVQDLAWAQALRDLPAEKRQQIVPHPPAAGEALPWLGLGNILRTLHCELAADGLDFAAVYRDGPKLTDFQETERWQALVALQQRYLLLLDAQKLWDIQTARLKAIEFREIQTDRDIILLGTVDLNNTLRQMLDQVADRVTAYIVAPEELADHFDAHGCLVPGLWCSERMPLRDEQLRQVDGPVEQAEAVSAWLGELDGRFQKDEIAIGVPDEALVPQLQRQLEQCGVPARWVEGARLAETPPYRLLAAAVRFAGRQRYEDLAGLLRHPDLEDWLQGPPVPSLPVQLDLFYNSHLPSRVYATQILPNGKYWPDLRRAVERIEIWLKEASATHPLRTWGGLFRKILGEIYGKRILQLDTPADEVLHRTIRCILTACDQLDAVPEPLDTLALPAADAFQIALGPLGKEALPPLANPDAIEILGWLELPLDDSAALVVTSFNEGFVPKATGADAFLPDRLRRELGLLHNERRYARDAYAASVLCHSRGELRVLFARRDTMNDPLQPSRLVFACADETLVERARRFFGEQKPAGGPRRLLLASGRGIQERSLFEVPRPEGRTVAPTCIPVTSFRAYLACPYRYYLRYERNLRAVDDSARELDGRAFGILLHEVFSTFGRDTELRQSDRVQDVFNFLAEQLAKQAQEIYGSDQRRPALRLQLEQARQRLAAFAAHQVELIRAGWRIVYAETGQGNELLAEFPKHEATATLVGRIDRIDFHEASKTLCILDYKTADHAEQPEKTHRQKDGWIDLQLPLYRHLWYAASLDLPDDCTVRLGYFNLPKAIEETGVALANWDEDTLAEADAVALEVIRKILAGIFWPPSEETPRFGDDFAAICLDNVVRGPDLGDDTPGGST